MTGDIDYNALVSDARAELATMGSRPSLKRVVVQALLSLDRYGKEEATMVARLNNFLMLGDTLDEAAAYALKEILEDNDATQ